jgi:Glycosyltransferase 61
VMEMKPPVPAPVIYQGGSLTATVHENTSNLLLRGVLNYAEGLARSYANLQRDHESIVSSRAYRLSLIIRAIWSFLRVNVARLGFRHSRSNVPEASNPPSCLGGVTGPKIHLSFQNASGSVEHFWHFFMAVLLPLIAWQSSSGIAGSASRILVRSCGPMDRILNELAWPNLVILPKKEHGMIINYQSDDLTFVSLVGMDSPPLYDEKVIRVAVSYLKHCWTISDNSDDSLLVIDRGPPDPFYLTSDAEIPNAGNIRRSIPNLSELAERLSSLGHNVKLAKLEELPLRQAAALFSQAKIVVLQHGAAMANLVFCQASTQVCEIIPKTLPSNILKLAFAKSLCQSLGLNYSYVMQEDLHSPVDVSAVIDAVLGNLALRSRIS